MWLVVLCEVIVDLFFIVVVCCFVLGKVVVSLIVCLVIIDLLLVVEFVCLLFCILYKVNVFDLIDGFLLKLFVVLFCWVNKFFNWFVIGLGILMFDFLVLLMNDLIFLVEFLLIGFLFMLFFKRLLV